MTRISKQKAIEIILSEQEKGTIYVDCLGVIRSKWELAESTFARYWKESISIYEERQNKTNKAIEEQYIDSKLKVVKNGLKTKNERLLLLQSQVDDCLSELKEGKIIDHDISGKPFVRNVTISEKIGLRRVFKELQSEISKIEGDYAPKKQDITTEDKPSQRKEQLMEEILKKLQK